MYYAKRLREDGSIEELHSRTQPMDNVAGLIVVSAEEYETLRAAMIGGVTEKQKQETEEEPIE